MNLQDILTNLLKGLSQSIQNHSLVGGNSVTPGKSDPNDIKTFSLDEIVKSGRFTPEERRQEYRRRGKSPSDVIDGVYNDTYLEDGMAYNDCNRDWGVDA